MSVDLENFRRIAEYVGNTYDSTVELAMNEAATEIADLRAMLADAQSGFIPGCGEDEEWCKRRDAMAEGRW